MKINFRKKKLNGKAICRKNPCLVVLKTILVGLLEFLELFIRKIFSDAIKLVIREQLDDISNTQIDFICKEYVEGRISKTFFGKIRQEIYVAIR